MAQLGWRQAELAAGAWMRAAGFNNVVVTSEAGDGGVDVIADGVVAQVKTRNAELVDLQDLVGAARERQATPLFFTTGIYEEDAWEWAPGHPGLELYQLRDDGEVIASNEAAASRLTQLAEAGGALGKFKDWLLENNKIDASHTSLPIETNSTVVHAKVDGHVAGVADLRTALGRAAGRELIFYSAGGFTLPAREAHAESAWLVTYNVTSGDLDIGLTERPELGHWTEEDAIRAAEPTITYSTEAAEVELDTPVAQPPAPPVVPASAPEAPAAWTASPATTPKPKRTIAVMIAAVVAVAVMLAILARGDGGTTAACEAWGTQDAAQRAWREGNTQTRSQLDPDGDGRACEELPPDRNCGDFQDRAAAQAFFDQAGPNDPHNLDRDGDGRVCETLP